MTICLLLAQTTLCMHAVLIVRYAAFVAARAAIVHDGKEKEKAAAAAAIACLPISPRQIYPKSLGSVSLGVDMVAVGALLYYAGDSLQDGQLRYNYAKNATKTEVKIEQITEGSGKDKKVIAEEVIVEVKHDYFLAVPIARRAFGSGGTTTIRGKCALVRPKEAKGDAKGKKGAGK